MSMKNIIALMVLMCFVTRDLIQGQTIHGKNIPRINMTAIRGTWYLTASTLVRDPKACSTFTIKEQSTDKWIIEIVSKPREKMQNQTLSHTSQNVTLNTNFKNDSNIIFTTAERGDGPCMAIFEMVPDSYMAVYLTLSEETIASGRNGIIYAFTREKKLPCEIFDRLKESNIYKEGTDRKSKLINIDCSICE